jgi:predicted membrane protein
MITTPPRLLPHKIAKEKKKILSAVIFWGGRFSPFCKIYFKRRIFYCKFPLFVAKKKLRKKKKKKKTQKLQKNATIKHKMKG